MELKTIKCENCGTENSSEFIFCGKCGERIDGKFYCPNCDQLLDKGTSFCLNCGKRFDGKKTCPQCQNIVDEEFNYCGNCGFSFVEKNIVEKKSNNTLIENASSQFIQTKKKEKVVKKPKCNGDYKAKPLIKYSLISLLALVMLILSFMPIFNEAEISKNVAETYYDGVELKNIKFSAIDYIGFLNDIDVANRTLRIQDISFDNKVEDLWYEINDLDSTDTSRKAKSLLTKIIKYEFKSLIREEVFYSNNEMKGINTHFIKQTRRRKTIKCRYY